MERAGRIGHDQPTSRTGWAESIIAAILPERRPSTALTISPLPVPELGPVPGGSSAHSMGRVDSSGRIAAQTVLDGLGWSPHDRLSFSPVSGVAVIRRDPACGTVTLPGRACLGIPSGIRARCGIEPGHSVLLTALLSHDLLLAYPEAVLERMILLFHTQLVAQD